MNGVFVSGNMFDTTRQIWNQKAIEASERSVRMAQRLLNLACARYVSGVVPIEEVWKHGELLVREIQIQQEIANAAHSSHWSKLASTRLERVSQELANLQQSYEQGVLHPSDVFFTELDDIVELEVEVEATPEIPQEGMALPFA